MNKLILKSCIFLFSVASFAQAGHIMQGVGSVNMSMGGAATAQPIDISGALQWNPASLSVFNDRTLKIDAGLFFSSPELSSTVTTPSGDVLEGTTKDDRGTSIMPSLAYVCGKEDSKHTFGASIFGISGFGVTFPESTSNPINMPQNPAGMGGFGHIESDYILLQIGLAWAYEITDNFSIGLQPTLDYATLELMPNPTANPNATGYPSTDKASAIGFGGQIGLYYDTGVGFKFGTSYKTPQYFGDFEFKNTHLDNSTAKNKFRMDYPGIWSLGAGYSEGDFDLAFDFRLVDYENTKGFSKTGWTDTGSVAGFGWKNIQIYSVGIQYKGVEKLPLRIGYTYSSNPIDSDVAFFNIPATAIIENAFQFGLSYIVNDKIKLDGLFHYGSSAGDTSGPMLFPGAVSSGNPYGAIEGSKVSYDMTTSMIMVGFNYSFGNKAETTE